MVDISPPGWGDVDVPATRLRVAAALKIVVDPIGEGAEYTPVDLKADVVLHDRATQRSILDPWFAGALAGPHIGDWRYQVVELSLSGGAITPATLVAIRLPALLRRALRGLVLLVKDGGYSLDPSDFDERAIAAYVTAQLIGEHPTSAVAAELGVKPNAAGQRVYRLRRAGRLPAVTPKKGKH